LKNSDNKKMYVVLTFVLFLLVGSCRPPIYSEPNESETIPDETTITEAPLSWEELINELYYIRSYNFQTTSTLYSNFTTVLDVPLEAAAFGMVEDNRIYFGFSETFKITPGQRIIVDGCRYETISFTPDEVSEFGWELSIDAYLPQNIGHFFFLRELIDMGATLEGIDFIETDLFQYTVYIPQAVMKSWLDIQQSLYFERLRETGYVFPGQTAELWSGLFDRIALDQYVSVIVSSEGEIKATKVAVLHDLGGGPNIWMLFETE